MNTSPCIPCCPTPQSVNIPGIQGDDGTDGVNGVNAFMLATADDTVPAAAGSSKTYAVDDSTGFIVGSVVLLAVTSNTWATFRVTALPTTTSVTLEFLGYPGDVAGGTAFLTGQKFVVGGLVGNRFIYVTPTAVSLAVTDYMDLILVTVDNKTITLPTAVGRTGRQFTIKQTAVFASGTTIATSGGQTIDGAATQTLGAQYRALTVASDGANWVIVSHFA